MKYAYPERRSEAMKKAGVYPKVTAMYVMRVIATNPNGDPAGGNLPRRLGDKGLITPMSQKRKIRDMITGEHGAFLQAVSDLGLKREQWDIAIRKYPDAAMSEDINSKLAATLHGAAESTHADARLFGIMLAPENKGKKEKVEKKGEKIDRFIRTGVVVIGNGISVAPVVIQSEQITRVLGMSVSDESEEQKEGGMGQMPFVQFGLYCFPVFVNSTKSFWTASKTTPVDIEVFRRLLPHTGDMRSASRHNSDIVSFYWYEHQNLSGDYPDWMLQDAFKPKLKEGMDGSDMSHYDFFDPTGAEAKRLFGSNVKFIHEFVVENTQNA
jgi:Cas7 group CRISPR-associated protein Csh2